jgi:hypothetical protein
VRRIKSGDVFEIITPKGKGYFQFVFDNKEICELIRVLPGIYTEHHSNIIELATAKEMYFVHFPLKAAIKQGKVDFIDNFRLPKDLELPKKMREDYSDSEGNRGWHIINYDTWQREFVQELSKEQLKLSPWEIWNDSMLIERLAEGWNLEQWV